MALSQCYLVTREKLLADLGPRIQAASETFDARLDQLQQATLNLRDWLEQTQTELQTVYQKLVEYEKHRLFFGVAPDIGDYAVFVYHQPSPKFWRQLQSDHPSLLFTPRRPGVSGKIKLPKPPVELPDIDFSEEFLQRVCLHRTLTDWPEVDRFLISQEMADNLKLRLDDAEKFYYLF